MAARTRRTVDAVWKTILRVDRMEDRLAPGDALRSLWLGGPAAPAETRPAEDRENADDLADLAATPSAGGLPTLSAAPDDLADPGKSDPPASADPGPVVTQTGGVRGADEPAAPTLIDDGEAAPFGVSIAAADGGPVAEPMFHGAVPMAGPGAGGYSPAQIRHAYGVDQLAADGAGQTIAVVIAYDAPTIKNDANVFSTQFGLPTFNTGGPTLTVVNQTGGTSLPAKNGGWAQETSLDVEWAHAIAPRANILVVEASSNSYANLFAAVDYAASQAHVVSMSWGGGEFSSEAGYDGHFNKPGVVFTAASGDSGSGAEYPAASPYVVGVGGTSLPLDAAGNRTGAETAWSGSGGGVSGIEAKPAYQVPFQSQARRGVPDVAWDANPNTGVWVYDSTRYQGWSGWMVFGGTSAGTPQVAATVALADQGRATPLSGNSLTASPFYGAATANYAANYTDVTSGSNGGYSAGANYDFVTGLGSPHANNLVPYLQGY